MQSPILRLINRYPQLMLEICEGAAKTERYKDIVLRGKDPGEPDASGYVTSPEDAFFTADTPAGSAEIYYAAVRSDFERIIRALAYKLEPVSIPATTGAMMIKGVINQEKLRAKKSELFLSSSGDAKEEYSAFIKNPENYKDTIIILSKGEYSALPHTKTPYSHEEWIKISRGIREYHELAHFVSGRLFPENKNALRDELVADCIGLIGATGKYDRALAEAFLGTDSAENLTKGRLKNYVAPAELEGAAEYAKKTVELLYGESEKTALSPFDFLLYTERNKIAII